MREQWLVSAPNPVNVRKEPSLKGAVLAQKSHGEMVTAARRVEAGGGWIQLAEHINGSVAWMRIADGRKPLLTRVPCSDGGEKVAGGVNVYDKHWLVVCPSGCNIREAASLRANSVGSLSPGEFIQV